MWRSTEGVALCQPRRPSPTPSAVEENVSGPLSGGASLRPTELDVVRLVGEGLPNKDIAAQLFISASHGGVAPYPCLPQGRDSPPACSPPRKLPAASTPALIKKGCRERAQTSDL